MSDTPLTDAIATMGYASTFTPHTQEIVSSRFARQLERDRHELIEELKRHSYHHESEDCWYSCATLTCDDRRKSDKCDCGADRVIALLEKMKP